MYKISNQQINSSSTRHAELVSASYVCRNPHVSSQTLQTLKQVQGDEVRVGLRAFTLAEVMIVLAIIGILVAILLPTAQNLTPDENLLKFKKANTSLTTAIRELVNSDKYYYDGDLGLDKEGNKIVEAKYFCSTLADILTTKSVNCSEDNLGYNTSALANLPNIETDEIDGVKIYEYADCMCKNNLTSGEEIKLNDNTIIYTINPYYHFGSLIDGSDKCLFNLCSEQKRYKFICLDIDNLNEGEDPFGYAIRADGKIIYGARAQAWIKANINNSEEELSTIATTNTCTPTALAITPENDVCKAIVQAPICTPSEHCITCNPNTNLCTECESGYKLVNGACKLKTPCEDVDCGELAMCIELSETKGICMTKYNIGDKPELPIALNVTITNSTNSESCDSKYGSQICCWQGTTVTSCDSINGDYSGCNRTACDWYAANKSCNDLTYLNKTWRLPNNDELFKIGEQINEISIGIGNNGLMLCDTYSGHSSSYCAQEANCLGSYAYYCHLNHLWSGNNDNSNAYYFPLSSGNWQVNETNLNEFVKSKGYALSVRCVSDL